MPFRFGKSANSIILVLCSILTYCCSSTKGTLVPAVSLNKKSVAAGAPVEISYSFAAKPNYAPESKDLTIFVHFIDAKGKTWFQDDHEPPKSLALWSPGEKHSWTRTIFVPRNIPSGDYSIILGVYSPSQKRRIPLEAESYNRNSYRLGRLTILPPDQQTKIQYSTGWYPPQTDPNDYTHTWRWTSKTATINVENAKVRSILYLKLEGVPEAYGIDQKLTIFLGSHELDSFSTVTHQPIQKKYIVDKDLLGTQNYATVTLSVNNTFVPASFGPSKDVRELGVLLHNFYLDRANDTGSDPR